MAMSAEAMNAGAAELGIMAGFPPPADKRMTLENWDSAPFNRWSFQNVRSVLPTRAVARGHEVSVLSAAAQALDDVACTDSQGRPTTVGEMLAGTYTDGFILLHRGRIVVERYLNGMSEMSLHLSQSVSKSLVGTLVGLMAGRGLLALGRPVSHYVPELGGCGYAGATLGQVLDMRSGVRFVEDYLDVDSEMGTLDRVSGWKPARSGDPGGIYDLILRLKQERPHGGHFAYRSIETDVLGWVLERVTGLGLAELMSHELWQPLGCEADACFTVDRAGTCLADGGLNACLRDYARFGQLYLDEGFANGRQIVPADWIAASRRADMEAFRPLYGERFSDFPQAGYSRQWWVLDSETGRQAALGVFGQMIYIDPAAAIVAVKLSSWPDFLNDAMRVATIRAIEAIARVLCG
jgi:CubicO group peptidase (beta-lactamase class C family)